MAIQGIRRRRSKLLLLLRSHGKTINDVFKSKKLVQFALVD